MKNIYHIAEDVSRASGGVRKVVFDIHARFPNSEILTTVKDIDDSQIDDFSRIGPWLYSRDFKKRLRNMDDNVLFHLHGVWMYPQFIAASIAIKNKIPFIISPHGMFEPWLWNEGVFKKRVYFKMLSKSIFAKASYIHAITPDEKLNLQILFPKTEIICIPNAIEIETISQRLKLSKPYFLFLGRLHPKKGLELLIDAFFSLKSLNFDLKIAGFDNDYSFFLKEKVRKLNDSRISFVGAVYGDAKKKLYREAYVFVAPSYSEVVGMVNLEAAMMGTPVITTFQTGLLKEWNDNGGKLINPSVNELKNAMFTVSKWSDEERDANGICLRNFVIKEYSWKVNMPKWQALYSSME